MTTDLWMLIVAVALHWALIVGSATPTLLKAPRWALGNRDTPGPPESDFQRRLRRSERNLAENLPLFAALVLVVHVAGRASPSSALGAQIFVGARLVHALLYSSGIPYLRTALWAVSVVGMAMVGLALF